MRGSGGRPVRPSRSDDPGLLRAAEHGCDRGGGGDRQSLLLDLDTDVPHRQREFSHGGGEQLRLRRSGFGLVLLERAGREGTGVGMRVQLDPAAVPVAARPASR